MYRASSLDNAIMNLYGEGVRIIRKQPVFGGDINRAYALELSNGTVIFMKANTRQKLGIFEGEAESLDFIRQTNTIRSPEVLAIGADGDDSFLLLEYIHSGPKTRESSEELGVGFARMHQADTSSFVSGGKFGALHDHLLGSGIQDNTPMNSWTEFFAECRLRPHFEKARHYFSSTERGKIDKLLTNIDKYLTEPEHPSLMH